MTKGIPDLLGQVDQVSYSSSIGLHSADLIFFFFKKNWETAAENLLGNLLKLYHQLARLFSFPLKLSVSLFSV